MQAAPRRMKSSKAYDDYVVFVDSKALRGRSKAEPSRGDASEIDCAKRSPKGAAAGSRGSISPGWRRIRPRRSARPLSSLRGFNQSMFVARRHPLGGFF
jgi:hypothetical protein